MGAVLDNVEGIRASSDATLSQVHCTAGRETVLQHGVRNLLQHFG